LCKDEEVDDDERQGHFEVAKARPGAWKDPAARADEVD
jgi:hypothetical protein